jgi:3-dehydroquinate synthase
LVISVSLGPRSYTIVVEPGALGTVGTRLRALGVGSRTVVVTDATILRLHGASVTKSLVEAGFTVTTLEVPEGEVAKTLAVAERCWDRLLAAGVDRTSTVLALGGGAIGDLAGFVAASYMRGINFVQLPTTVLAQVDASIGGKTAIDHPRAKNLIGAFHQPRLVIVDPAVARTLPAREFRSGLAEVVKHGIVLDAGYFDDVERSAAALLDRDLDTMARIIGGSCRLKAGVIERDPEEKGELRYALNAGHTIGHALEAVTRFETWTHGEAVALGLVAEAHLAEQLGLAASATTRRQEALLRVLGLPVRAPAVDVDAVLEAITRDKKARDGRIPFVLAPAIGAFRVVYDVAPGVVRCALALLGRTEVR